jgi:nucleoside-diphosphate-sugar epimerase
MTGSGRLFCFGLGFSALTLAAALQPAGFRVAGTCRRPEKAAALAARGITPFLFDRDRPLDTAAALAGTSLLLISVPPDAAGDPVLDAHLADILALSPRPEWVGYLSTTGVYGDTGGAVVDEDSPVAPTQERSRRRALAERRWLALVDQGLPVHVFRLAGIYGPGRSALDSVRAGTARRIDKPGQVFSRIHVEDIATVLRASIARPRPGAIYNVADDEPAPGHEVIAHACGLLGVEPPPLEPFDPATLSPMAASFYADNRIVSNRRMKQELGITLKYPTYREGLA